MLHPSAETEAREGRAKLISTRTAKCPNVIGTCLLLALGIGKYVPTGFDLRKEKEKEISEHIFLSYVKMAGNSRKMCVC